MTKKLQIDWILFAAVALLSLFGVLMVTSASAMISLKETGGASQTVYALKQFGFTVAGLFLMLLATRFDYRWLRQPWLVASLLLLTFGLLLAVFGFPPVNGARRWIKFAGMSFQPSELAKPVLALFLAFFFAKRQPEMMGDWKMTVAPCAVIVALMLGLVYLEPDLGTTLVLAATFAIVYLVAGADLRHFAIAGILGAAAIAAALVFVPFRMRRMLVFLDPWADEKGAGYQVIQSLYAVGSGGAFGVGFFNSQQKIYYLPFAHSDFIFAIACEELGLVGALSILAAFGVILWRGTRAAMLAPDKFGKYLAVGLTVSIVAQAFFNMSVAIGMLPTKGIPLPFISYGGSSVVVTLVSMGLLLNISQHAGELEFEDEE